MVLLVYLLSRSLARGARAAVYPENISQRDLILSYAMRAGFSSGVVVDYPHSSKSKKEYLVFTCGPPSLSSAVPAAKEGDEEGYLDDGDEEHQVVVADRNRPRKRQKMNENVKGKKWVLKKKQQLRDRGEIVPKDTKYTARKRKTCF